MLSSPPNSSSAELKLDPGPPPRRRSKIGCQCTLWTLFTIVCVGGSFLVLKFLYSGFNHLRAPHPKLYQDMKVPYKLNEVVQPLINSNHTFDIVATVWLRKPAPIQDDDDATNKILEDGGPILVEEAIYTGTVFRGLHLKNKDIKTAVKFRVPTGIFKNLELNNHDLRASFVLIPNAPSLLDHAVNYSSWIPSTVNYPPARSWS
ncbi:hypothetical protein BDZ97DRAFT_1662418 [Flammula alnicola]|nr:hypothetical protein BDZ97DRAFT_1662418 [Flammula alnicola]